VAPFFMASSYVGETPSLPMIDITLSKEGACPVQWWGMLYEGWVPNPDEEGTTVFLQGYEESRAEQRAQEDLYDGDDAGSGRHQVPSKIISFYERLLAEANAGTPLMQHYFDNYYDL